MRYLQNSVAKDTRPILPNCILVNCDAQVYYCGVHSKNIWPLNGLKILFFTYLLKDVFFEVYLNSPFSYGELNFPAEKEISEWS